MVNFVGKLCLAPMVRSGEIATRLLALKNGADLVWTPEYVDKKILQTTRTVNESINTIDYIVDTAGHQQQPKNGKKSNRPPPPPKVIFRTHPPSESGKLIFQLGTSDPNLAVEAAQKVIGDVDGIDLNCGCPKPFSTHSGMGAALLSTPDLLCSILSALVEKVGVPNNKSISCKIRLLQDYNSTFDLISKICDTGITNLTIHCRTREMRNRQDPIWTYLRRLIPYIQGRGVSVVINGNIQSRLDLKNLQSVFGNTQVGGMIAECAEANASVFGEKLPLTADKVVQQYLDIAKTYNYDNFPNSKFMILNQTPGKSKYYKKFAQSRSYEDFDKVLEELKDDKEEVLINRIYTKDLQKQRSLTESEYQEHIDARLKLMEKMAEEDQQDQTKIEEPELVQTETKEVPELVQMKRTEVPIFSEKTKQQKPEAV